MLENNQITTHQVVKDYYSVPLDEQVFQSILDRPITKQPDRFRTFPGASNNFACYQLVNSMFTVSSNVCISNYKKSI